MTNKEIANAFDALAAIMELHQDNPFKIKSYQNAYLTLRKWSEPLAEMNPAEIATIKGVGKAIAEKIQELLVTGKMQTLEEFKVKTPQGVQEMLQIKGFGPKKILTIWKELEVETIGELLYACNENRLIELKGFGKKTQEDLIQKLEYFQKSKDKFLFAQLEKEADELFEAIKSAFSTAKVSFTGDFRRKNPIVKSIDFLIGQIENVEAVLEKLALKVEKSEANLFICKSQKETPIHVYTCENAEFGSKLFRYSASKPFLDAFIKKTNNQDFRGIEDENTIFEKANLPFIEPELRDWEDEKLWNIPNLIDEKAIKGVLHTHTTYSDGVDTLEEMAAYSQKLGYEYILISDHSKAAFYANGLKEDRLFEQFKQIDALNKTLTDFKIFKGIECDILNDGSLDYDNEILKQFDCVIASVHSNLKMDETKATNRILKAVENPFTKILGHPTGRLLLSRTGYPLDFQKIIDACAANGVSIELNANPYRLDIDWTWIPKALAKGILISINPDAHSKRGIHDIKYGVLAARKGGLSIEKCLNTKNLNEFETWLKSK